MPCDPLRHQTSSPSPAQRPCSPGTPFFRHTLAPLPQSHSRTHMHRPHHIRRHSHSGVSLTQSNSQTYPITHLHTQSQTHTCIHSHLHAHTHICSNHFLNFSHTYTYSYSHTQTLWQTELYPQNSCSPRVRYGNTFFTDIIKVKIEMILYWIRVNPKSNESTYNREKRKGEAFT